MNREVRDKIREAGLHQWQVAKACGVNEYTFIRWLRDDLSDERRKMIAAAIDRLSRKEA